jgi:hypothetical protein
VIVDSEGQILFGATLVDPGKDATSGIASDIARAQNLREPQRILKIRIAGNGRAVIKKRTGSPPRLACVGRREKGHRQDDSSA